MAELSKFDELRMKTEKQLIGLVNSDLDLGIREARQALRSADTWPVAADHYHRAKRAYAEASRLIPLLGRIPEHEQARWEASLEHLQKMLEGLSVIGSTPTLDKDNIPSLARALWKAPVGTCPAAF